MKNKFRKIGKTASEGVRKLSLLLLSVVILSSIAVPFNAVEADVTPEYTDNIIISQEDHYDLKNTNLESSFENTDNSSDEQVGMTREMIAYSTTDNIVGEVFARTLNNAIKSKEAGEESSDNNNHDEYPTDHHERSYYGDSPRVRDLENDNYLVYRDTYLLVSEADSKQYSISYSDDKLTAYVSPAFSQEQLTGKTGIVFLAQKLDSDTVLVFNGDPQVVDGRLVVPLVATKDITLYQLFSDGKLSFSAENGTPTIDWTDNISGTNWSGTITDHSVDNIDFDLRCSVIDLSLEFVIKLDLSFGFDITTRGGYRRL